MITSKQRFINCINFKNVDRLPCTFSATPRISKKIMEYYKLDSPIALHNKLGVDVRGVSPKYTGPNLSKYEDGSFDGLWGERYKYIDIGKTKLRESVYLPLADVGSISELRNFKFPTPDWFDYSNIEKDCDERSEYAVFYGCIKPLCCDQDRGFARAPFCAPDFINGISRIRGMEQVLMDIALEDEVFLWLIDNKTDVYCNILKRVLNSAKGKIDFIWFGDDIGNQNGPMLSPRSFDRIFAPRYKKLFETVHSYGAKTMMHSCGSVRKLLPSLIECGLDILDVVQPEPDGMDLFDLKKEFGNNIVFSGSMSVQTTLPNSTKQQIIDEVKRKSDLFAGGGLILGPTNAIQGDTPLENIIAMYETIGSIEY